MSKTKTETPQSYARFNNGPFAEAEAAPSSSKLETRAQEFWRKWQINEGIHHHTIDDWPVRFATAFAKAEAAPKPAESTEERFQRLLRESRELNPKPAESLLEVYSKLLVDIRQFLVDAQLSFVDQIRKIDTLIGDIETTSNEREISIAPFGLDNDHI